MKIFRRLMAVGLMVAACSTTAGGQVVVVSAKSADGLISGIRSVVAATDAGEPIQPVLAFLDNLKAPGSLKGLDRTRALGAYGEMKDGAAPYAVILVPITNQADFLALLAGYGVQSRPTEGVSGVTHSIELPGDRPMTLLGRFEEGYACFTNRPAGPPATPALKPATLLAGRPAMLAATVRLDLVPASMKAAILGQMDATTARDREQRPGEDDAARQGRVAGMLAAIDSFKALLRDGGALSVEVAESRGDLNVELVQKALPGSRLAGAFRAFGATSSLFRGIGAGSVAEAYVRGSLSDEMKKAFEAVATRSREDLAKDGGDGLAKDLARESIDLSRSILQAPAFDGGAALLGPFREEGQGPAFSVVLAVKVEDGPRVDRLLRKLAGAADKDRPPILEKVTLDKDKAVDDGTAIHEVRLKPGIAALDRFGEPVIRVATRRDAVVVALGSWSLPAIRQALGAIARPPAGPAAPQVKVEAALGKAALAFAGTPQVAEQLGEMFRANHIFQGADAARDRVGLAISVGQDLTIRLRLDGPTLGFLAKMGVQR